MKIKKSQIQGYNERFLYDHEEKYFFINQQLDKENINADDVVVQIQNSK